jgi:hypothetical protein
MRAMCKLSIGMVLLAGGGLVAADEPKGPSGVAPSVALARAVAGDKEGVSLRIRVPNSMVVPVMVTVKVPVQVQKVVDGKTVVETREVERREMRTEQRFGGWREINVKVDGEEVFVHDLDGKKVPADKLPDLLAKEAPILLSSNGKVDHFYLQTTKEGTLVMVLPPQQFYGVPKFPQGVFPKKELAPAPPIKEPLPSPKKP